MLPVRSLHRMPEIVHKPSKRQRNALAPKVLTGKNIREYPVNFMKTHDYWPTNTRKQFLIIIGSVFDKV